MRVWNQETYSCIVLAILEPKNIDVGVASVSISPDGRWVAAGSLDCITRVWDLKSGALVERLHGHTDSVYSVRFNPDGCGLVTGSLDKTSKYWDITPMIRAVNAGNWRGLADRVSLRQDGISASIALPIPGGKEEGGGEMGSICTAVSAGHKVRYLRYPFARVYYTDYFRPRIMLSQLLYPLTGNWLLLDLRITESCYGIHGMPSHTVYYKATKTLVRYLSIRVLHAPGSLIPLRRKVISVAMSPTGGLFATGSGDRTARVCECFSCRYP